MDIINFKPVLNNLSILAVCFILSACVSGTPWLFSGQRSFNNQCVGFKLTYPKELYPSDPRGFETLLRDLTVRSGRTIFFAQKLEPGARYNPTLVIRILNTPFLGFEESAEKLEALMTDMQTKMKSGKTSKLSYFSVAGKKFIYFDISIEEHKDQLKQRLIATTNNKYLIMIFLNAENDKQITNIQSILKQGMIINHVDQQREQSNACKKMRNKSKPKIQKLKNTKKS